MKRQDQPQHRMHRLAADHREQPPGDRADREEVKGKYTHVSLSPSVAHDLLRQLQRAGHGRDAGKDRHLSDRFNDLLFLGARLHRVAHGLAHGCICLRALTCQPRQRQQKPCLGIQPVLVDGVAEHHFHHLFGHGRPHGLEPLERVGGRKVFKRGVHAPWPCPGPGLQHGISNGFFGSVIGTARRFPGCGQSRLPSARRSPKVCPCHRTALRGFRLRTRKFGPSTIASTGQAS